MYNIRQNDRMTCKLFIHELYTLIIHKRKTCIRVVIHDLKKALMLQFIIAESDYS